MIRCLIRYWKRALDITSRHQSEGVLLNLVFWTLYSKSSILWVQSSRSQMQCNSLMRRPQLSLKWFWSLKNYSNMSYWSSRFSFCLCVIRQMIITDCGSWWWSPSFKLKRKENYYYVISSNDLMNADLSSLVFSVIHLATTLKEAHKTSINKLSLRNVATPASGQWEK